MAMLCHRQNGWQGQGEHPLLTLLLQSKEGLGMEVLSKSPSSATLLQQALAERLQSYEGGHGVLELVADPCSMLDTGSTLPV